VRKNRPKSQSSTKANRRGSKEAVEKRRAARRFNDVLSGGAPTTVRDGRTEKRRQRLLKELADGSARGGKLPLKPIDVLLRVQGLLELGETMAAIRKARRPPKEVEVTDALVEGVRHLQEAYQFDPAVYRFVGIGDEALARAGILRPSGPKARASKAVLGRAPTRRRPGLARSAEGSSAARRGAA
jgi:hypothetical protein